jgi:hypothetical protein
MTFAGSAPITPEEWEERQRRADAIVENKRAGDARRAQRAAGKIGGHPKRDDAHCIALAEDFRWHRAQPKWKYISDTALMREIGDDYGHGKTAAYMTIRRGFELLGPPQKTVRDKL